MYDLTLQIRRKTLVASRRQRIKRWRSDWVPVGYLYPHDTRRLFAYFGEGGKIRFDSEFIFWIAKRYGFGEYSVIAFRKHRRGMYGFLHFRCDEGGYIRVKSRRTKITMVENEWDDEDEELYEQKEIEEGHAKCSPHLRSCTPLFATFHTYNEVPPNYQEESGDIGEHFT